MWRVPNSEVAQAARYAAFCDLNFINSHLYETMLALYHEPELQQSCQAAKVEAVTEWEQIKSIEDQNVRNERISNIFLEIWTWTSDFHLKLSSAMILLKLGKASDEQMFYFFSIVGNSSMYASMGFPLATEAALTLAHWRVQDIYANHRSINMSFARKTLSDAVRLLAQKLIHDPRASVESKEWAQLLSTWIDPTYKAEIDIEQRKGDADFYLSYAVCRQDRDALRNIAAQQLPEPMRKLAVDLLVRLGEPPVDAFETTDAKAIEHLLHVARGSLNAKMLEQILAGLTNHHKLIWTWLKRTGRNEWKNEELRSVLHRHLVTPLLSGVSDDSLADFFNWVFEVFSRDKALPDSGLLREVTHAWDDRVAAVGNDVHPSLWNTRAFSHRFAMATAEEFPTLVPRFGLAMTKEVINSISGWDNWTERMGWNCAVNEGHLVAEFASSRENAKLIREFWSLREDDPSVAHLWQAVASGHRNTPELMLVLSKPHKGFVPLLAAARRFAPNRNLAELVGDQGDWARSVAPLVTLYDSVDLLEWIPPTQASWLSFYDDFQARFIAGKPDIGRINAWIKLARALKQQVEASPETWEPVLRRFLKGWKSALASAKGVIHNSDHQSADREMMRTLMGDSSQLLCLLAG